MKIILTTLLLTGFSAVAQLSAEQKEVVKQEIVRTEAAFRDLLQEKGASHAFWAYAAPDAAIERQDSIYKGPEAIRAFYAAAGRDQKGGDWKPDRVEVSDDGSLAWTYGRYIWRYKDKDGKEQAAKGYFHTVWKRMPDGSYRYVWD